MPTSLTFDEQLDALERAGYPLVEFAVEAGMDADVPSCPTWTASALLAHQTMVHRWATAQIRGDDPDAVPSQTEIRSTVPDLPAYYLDGFASLLTALRAAPPDLVAMTFLNDAPPPRQFWARRQAHETTMHMVDALASRLARLPAAAETGITPALAADGIDELLRGFFTRGRSKLFDRDAYTVVVAPTDSDRRWVLHVGESMTVAPDADAGAGEADATITGGTVDVYLALWNRGGAVDLTGRADVLDRWRETQRIRWS